MALLQIPHRVREAAQALNVKTKSLLLEVLKVGDEEEMIRLLEEVSRRGLNRDDLRRQQRGNKPGKPQRRKPFIFSFRSPDKSFNMSLKFRQSTVSRDELIQTLEQVLQDLRNSEVELPTG